MIQDDKIWQRQGAFVFKLRTTGRLVRSNVPGEKFEEEDGE